MFGTRVVVDLLMAAGADCLLETVFAGFGYGARALALFFDFAVFGILLYHPDLQYLANPVILNVRVSVM